MFISKGNWFISLNTHARAPWSTIKVYPRNLHDGLARLRRKSTHIVWGRLSLRYGEFECSECRDTGELPSGSVCSACCEHGEYDHGICYDCGTDCTDELIAEAEYRYEAYLDRYYGN